MKYTHVTIYKFPAQTMCKRHVKIVSLTFTYLSLGFNAPMLNRKRVNSDPSSLHYCRLRLRSEPQISALQTTQIFLNN
jgi:hypothetical protein